MSSLHRLRDYSAFPASSLRAVHVSIAPSLSRHAITNCNTGSFSISTRTRETILQADLATVSAQHLGFVYFLATLEAMLRRRGTSGADGGAEDTIAAPAGPDVNGVCEGVKQVGAKRPACSISWYEGAIPSWQGTSGDLDTASCFGSS